MKWAYSTYQKFVYACSFGAEGIVLIDLISKVVKEADIVFLDTGLHFPETYELINEVKDRYPGLSIRFLNPASRLKNRKNAMAANFGNAIRTIAAAFARSSRSESICQGWRHG